MGWGDTGDFDTQVKKGVVTRVEDRETVETKLVRGREGKLSDC